VGGASDRTPTKRDPASCGAARQSSVPARKSLGLFANTFPPNHLPTAGVFRVATYGGRPEGPPAVTPADARTTAFPAATSGGVRPPHALPGPGGYGSEPKANRDDVQTSGKPRSARGVPHQRGHCKRLRTVAASIGTYRNAQTSRGASRLFERGLSGCLQAYRFDGSNCARSPSPAKTAPLVSTWPLAVRIFSASRNVNRPPGQFHSVDPRISATVTA